MASTSALSALIRPFVEQRPDATMLVDRGRAISWREFDVLCRRTASWLSAQGVAPGDRVAVWLVNRVEWLALLFALARVGAAMVAVNTRYRAAELEYILQRSGAKMLVLQLNFGKIDFPLVLRDANPACAQALVCVAVVDADASTPDWILGRPTLAFDPLGQPLADAHDGSDPAAVVLMIPTSGTTRGPKLAMHPQGRLTAHNQQLARAAGLDAPGASLLAVAPFCGVGGLNPVLGAMAGGATVHAMDMFDAAAAAHTMQQQGITHVFGLDVMFRGIIDQVPGHDPFPAARRLHYISLNDPAGFMPFAHAAAARRIPLLPITYGSSEMQGMFALPRCDRPMQEMVQAPGWPISGDGDAVRIRDLDTGAILGPEQSGALEIKSATGFVGYHNNEDATRDAMTPDGYFRTGDVARQFADGSFIYEARQGDSLRLAGFLVSPIEVEEVLKRLPGVVDAQVVGVQVEGAHRCVAFIISAPAGAPSEAEVVAWAAARLAPFKVPARVWFVSDYPITEGPNGVKVQRGKLREMGQARLAPGG